jgi:hypothetical protein
MPARERPIDVYWVCFRTKAWLIGGTETRKEEIKAD